MFANGALSLEPKHELWDDRGGEKARRAIHANAAFEKTTSRQTTFLKPGLLEPRQSAHSALRMMVRDEPPNGFT
jgi:hypothetical protein